jgi:hypothetical protein
VIGWPCRVDLTGLKRIVIQVLSGLTAYGYYAGSLTGVVDEDARVLSQMQKDNNLKITGTVIAKL